MSALKLATEILRLRALLEAAGVSEHALDPWTPFERADAPGLDDDAECYVNSRYQVIVRKEREGEEEELHILSIKTLDKAAHHDWRDLQRIKNELVGPEAEGVELYPAESRLVDTANQYWLHVFPRMKFQIGMGQRKVSEAQLNGTRQRPFEKKPPDLIAPEELAAQVRAYVANGGKP